MRSEDNTSTKPAKAVFIHSKLDDYGLNTTAFRVYCHIARRGECYGSAGTIARVCRVHRKSVFPALKLLLSRKMVEAEHRQGRTTVYKVTPLLSWLAPLNPSQNNTQVGRPKIIPTGCPKVIPTTRPDQIATHPSQNNTHKGIPSEVPPPEVSPNRGEAPLSASQIILKEKQLERVEEELRRIREFATQTPFGEYSYTPQQQARREILIPQKNLLKKELGYV